MKILGISFGSQNGTNDTICKAALSAAKAEGAEVTFINAFDIDIKHCIGCCACVKRLLIGKGNHCVLKDDFDWLLDKMLDADGIIVSDPIFEKGAAGLFRTMTDRFGPRMDRGNNIIGAEVAEKTGDEKPDPRILKDKVISYVAVGGSDWGTRVQCDHAMHAMTPMWKVIDNAWFPWAKEIIMDDERMNQILQIGSNLVEAAKNIEEASYLGQAGVCPHCQSRNFYLSPESASAICCLCGIKGEIKIADGKLQFVFPEQELSHAHNTISGKFIHGDDIYRMESKFVEIKMSEEFKNRKNKYNAIVSKTKK